MHPGPPRGLFPVSFVLITFACALAGSLALAATAVLSALSHITGIQCLNVLHNHFLLSDVVMINAMSIILTHRFFCQGITPRGRRSSSDLPNVYDGLCFHPIPSSGLLSGAAP